MNIEVKIEGFAPPRPLGVNMLTETEFKVRAHTSFSVTKFQAAIDPKTNERRNLGSCEVASNITLKQASEVALALGKSEGGKVTVLQADERILGGGDSSLEMHDELLRRLLEMPRGSEVFFNLTPEDNYLEEAWLVPRTIYDPSPIVHLGGDDKTDTVKALGLLPYGVVAAMRQNARKAGDQDMLELLDAAQVAVDA